MSDSIQFHSRVDDDGMLNVQLNLGPAEAKKEVVVTIQPLFPDNVVQQVQAMDWLEFVDKTYGSCANSGLKRHDQGEFEAREPI